MHPPRQGDIKYSVADISKAVRELGFKPTVTLEDYIKQQLSR
jgi:nucleoside-diphosphate-sugar epimerase